MITWAAKRRLFYISIILIPIILVFTIVFYFTWYEEPTCFDGKKNGDEVGIDCGGSCTLICTSQALDPEVLWARSFEVVPGMYNLVAYIENPNIKSEVPSAPYVFRVYDQDNNLILERRGQTRLPQRKTFAIFEGRVRTGDIKPTRVTFEFTKSELAWHRVVDDEPNIEVQSTVLVGTDSSPRIDAVLQNRSVSDFEDLEIIAIVLDGDNNAVQVSRTLLESLESGEGREIVFTWPQPFEFDVEVCTAPVDAVLVIDRSGSMNDDSLNPPEPLSTVKQAANNFVAQLMDRDQVSVVSFATEATLDIPLSSSSFSIQDAISSISIGPNDGMQHTNILDGLLVANDELESDRDNPESDNVIILLTDGIATRPEKSGNINYPEESALNFADGIRGSVDIYTIGLGSKVNDSFLKSIATDDQYYYTAPEKEDLVAIYKEIATSICRKGPNVIQIIPLVNE